MVNLTTIEKNGDERRVACIAVETVYSVACTIEISTEALRVACNLVPAIELGIPYVTTLAGARAALNALISASSSAWLSSGV